MKPLLYRGLRVRMGIHTGEPRAQQDPVTGRMDYFGPMVNKSARVESIAQGGQLLVSKEALNQMQLDEESMIVDSLGEVQLKGLSTKTDIFQVMPISLQARKFDPLVTNSEGPVADMKGQQDLRAKLKALDEANAALREKLAHMDASLNHAMERSKIALKQVRDAKMNRMDPGELYELMGREMTELIVDQEAVVAELANVRAKEARIDRLVDAAATRKASVLVDAEQMKMIVLNHQLSQLKQELQDSEELERKLQIATDGLEAAELQVSEWQTRLDDHGEDQTRLVELDVKINSLKQELEAAKQGPGPTAQSDDLQQQLDESDSLQRALSMRIDLLESEVDQGEVNARRMAQTLRKEQDRFAAEEFDLKANIRELEKRLDTYVT